MSQNQQIVFSPNLYANQMVLAYGSATTLTVTAGQVRDSLNVADLITTATLTINCALNGYNGLDTGALANSTMYYLFAIGDSSLTHPTGFIVSLSSTTPLLPL